LPSSRRRTAERSTQAQQTIMPRLRRAERYERVDLGQGNRQVSAKLHGKNITLDQVVKTAGEAVWSSPL